MTLHTLSSPSSTYRLLTGSAKVAGVIGAPISHSLSPRLHGAWINALALDAAYIPLTTTVEHFPSLITGLKGCVMVGLNVTLPFKSLALALADDAEDQARRAGAANLLLFLSDGRIEARNTDGIGLLYALRRQAPGWRADFGPITVLGAGGAARGAIVALATAGATDIRVLNRTRSRALALAAEFDCKAYDFSEAQAAFDGAVTLINTTSGQLNGTDALPTVPQAPPAAVAMDMVYRPLLTPFLIRCAAQGYQCVDGLDMLIGQAIPSFEAFFGKAPPAEFNSRALLMDDRAQGNGP